MNVTCDCGSMVLVRQDRRGTQVRCPNCNALIDVPDLPAPPPLPPAAATPKTPPLPSSTSAPLPPPLPTNTIELQPTEGARRPNVAALARELAQSVPPEPAADSESRPGSEPHGLSGERREAEGKASEALPPPLPIELPGMEPSAEGRRSSLHLAIALAMIGLFSAAPAIMHLAQNSPGAALAAMALPRWSVFLLLVSGLHLVYAVYVAQLPDWSTVWVVAITMLVVATIESVLLAATLLGSQQSSVVRVLELQQHLRGGRAAGWCFIMLCLSATTAYGAGRLASRWRAMESARLQALHIAE